jgi:hypothetical protein
MLFDFISWFKENFDNIENIIMLESLIDINIIYIKIFIKIFIKICINKTNKII